jgi:hypothetical protein
MFKSELGESPTEGVGHKLQPNADVAATGGGNGVYCGMDLECGDNRRFRQIRFPKEKQWPSTFLV